MAVANDVTQTQTALEQLVPACLVGDAQKLEVLANLVQERVYPYLRRVILDQHKAEDLTQDTVLAVLKSLGNLKQSDRFWPWVFMIASNHVRLHFRQSRHRTISMSGIDEENLAASSCLHDVQAASSARELAGLTQQAMERVGERYRMVLALRFYEDLSHAEIAKAIGSTELNARALFFRAKHAITRELKRLGVKRSSLLAALAAFGRMTVHPNSVSAAMVSISEAAATESVLTGLLTVKAKAIVLAAFLLAGAGTWGVIEARGRGNSLQGRSVSAQQRAMFHLPAAAPLEAPAQAPAAPPLYVRVLSRGMNLGAPQSGPGEYEIWICYPEGAGGPHFSRSLALTDEQRVKADDRIETAYANYRVVAERNEVHIENARFFCRQKHTATLPTDPAAFCSLIAAMDGDKSHALVDKKAFTFVRDPGTDFVIAGTDSRYKTSPPYQIKIEYNPPLHTDLFNWTSPAGMTVVDDRDAMRRRGWTYYRMRGHLGGRAVGGTGCIPFTYAASRTNPPWLKLQIGQFHASDNGREAIVRDAGGAAQLIYAGGSLLRGTGRPWEGFHTADIIRRDAAARGSGFRTGLTDDGKLAVRVAATVGDVVQEGAGAQAEYIVDEQSDLLESVRYWLDGGVEAGFLDFTYLQEIDGLESEFAPPAAIGALAADAVRTTSPLWPVELAAQLGLAPVGP